MDRIQFVINGNHFSVGSEVNSSTTLLEYLRKHLELRGTKYMCLEGGCGACIVNVTKSPGGESQEVNSCMVPITSCHDWDITTIEKIGNRLQGYHPLQKTLAESNGSQCGYCSPGWVMAMYSILRNKRPTMLEVEQSFGSNICRCTGYRPILEAFKKFASDAPNILDIEDLQICKKSNQPCSKNNCEESDWCIVSKDEVSDKMLYIVLNDNRDWYKATSVSDIFTIFNKKGTQSYMLLGGNTGKGVYPILEYPKVLININGVSELTNHYVDQNLVIGGATTLTELMNIFDSVANIEYFGYLRILNEHLSLVAHITIKNDATVAGNLMLKNLHLDFKSDIFLLFETVGAQVTIMGSEVNSSTTLLEYLRKHLELRGTKYMCLEGGCGACIVNVTKSPGGESQGVNSCMVPITSCHDWDITTIEKIGNRLQGYHPLQKTLAESNGSQCGYCSPGWVMAMYSILRNKRPTMLEVEQSFGSNICRCTGYRPILEAFKKFASDASNILDIEDLQILSKDEVSDKMLHIVLNDNRDWYKATSVSDIFTIFNKKGTQSYMLLGGNTGKGVYPILEYPKVLININGVSELTNHYVDQNLVIGGATTLTELMNIFDSVANIEYFGYLRILNEHLSLVAHITIKNDATVAGNLMLKNLHLDFKSDIFLLFETVGAQVTIMTGRGRRKTVTMQAFLKENITGKILFNIQLPPLSTETKLVTYKIMPRSQNAHALVHAGFLYKIDKNEKVKDCRIVYGGLSPSYIRSFKTERYLIGKQIFRNETLQGALQALNSEMVVTESLPDPPVLYRRQVALALFYKGLLSLYPREKLNPRYITGGTKIHETRPVSQGQQIFDTNPTIWPLNKPIPKLEGVLQCAGEAEYTEDLPTLPGEVYAAFVLTKVALGNIISIDASKALAEHGVIAFYTAADIPGKNSFVPAVDAINKADEEFLCYGEVKYYNQPLGIIVAEIQSILEKAVSLVEVKYTNVKQPILDIAIAKYLPNRVTYYDGRDFTARGNNVSKVIKGEQTIYTQYPFTLETLTGISHNTEEGLRLYNTTQWMDAVQVVTSRALLIDQNRIDVHVRRIGGGYGYKLSRSTPVVLASSLVTLKLNRPCRFIQSLRHNMRSTGKRAPCSTNYEIGVSHDGIIQYLDYYLYSDNGCIANETLLLAGVGVYNNAYKKAPWKYRSFNVTTDTTSHSWVRGPGSLEHIAMIETMIERISYELNLDPFDVRLSNLDTIEYSEMVDMVERIKKDSQYNERKAQVIKFNFENRWKKRGIRVSFLRWDASVPKYLDINMNVYKDDGTVAITHGGIEMGQGINTVAVQICAYFLGIPVEKIQIKPTNTIVAPNNSGSDSSVTTQNVGIGVRKCCEELLKKLKPVRDQLQNPTWVELIQKAYSMNLDLQVHGHVNADDALMYNIYGITVAEVEIDILTGEWEILRVDLIEDVGRSINPYIDIGQVEGAFTMGFGYWTSENIVYSPSNGEVLTDRTWEYWVPGARDIPQDFRIYFRKRSFSNEAILGAKATGEPATCMAIVIPFAIRAAIASARKESGLPITEWFQMDGAFTVDKICSACRTNINDYKFY